MRPDAIDTFSVVFLVRCIHRNVARVHSLKNTFKTLIEKGFRSLIDTFPVVFRSAIALPKIITKCDSVSIHRLLLILFLLRQSLSFLRADTMFFGEKPCFFRLFRPLLILFVSFCDAFGWDDLYSINYLYFNNLSNYLLCLLFFNCYDNVFEGLLKLFLLKPDTFSVAVDAFSVVI